jgi:hypothetical protein
VPCFKLEAKIGVRGFQRQFLHAGRYGAYLAIAEEGELEAGDAVEIVHRPDHEVTPALVIEALLLDRSRVHELSRRGPTCCRSCGVVRGVGGVSLDRLVGTWQTEARFPNGVSGTGTTTFELVLGGEYLPSATVEVTARPR